VLGW